MQTERRHYKSFIDDSARWDALALRDDDIIIVTPSKSGTTWMQQCVSLVLFQTPDPPAPMAVLSPWLDMLTWPLDELVATIEALHEFERELSDLRTRMHGVIDAIDRVIVSRRVAGTAG